MWRGKKNMFRCDEYRRKFKLEIWMWFVITLRGVVNRVFTFRDEGHRFKASCRLRKAKALRKSGLASVFGCAV